MKPFIPAPIPQHVHPLIRQLFEEMNRQQVSMARMGDVTGIDRATIKNWKHRHEPKVSNLDACLSALGYKLTLERLG